MSTIFGGKSRAQKQAEADAAAAAKQQAAIAQEALGLSREQFAKQKEVLNPVQDFYGKIAGGDRNAILNLLAPEIGQLTDSANGARRSQAALTPRGGSRVATNANINDTLSRSLNELVFSARPQAMQQLTGLGSLYGGQGTNMFSQGGSNNAAAGQQSMNVAQFLNSQRSNMFGQLLGSTLGLIAGPAGSALGAKIGSKIGGAGGSGASSNGSAMGKF